MTNATLTNAGRFIVMPKLIVLFDATDGAAAALAENAAAGAKGVRFTEVDVRVLGEAESSAGHRQRRLESADQLRDYDGVVVACSSSDRVPQELGRLLDDLESAPASSFVNAVFTLLGAEQTPLLARVARLGGIVVSPPPGVDEPGARAAAAGARAAKVVAWVRHALSHEQLHQQQHHRDHEHHPSA